ncbi:hypothetical protein M758_UG292900 [Ceratodon purpureus]|nr:hypothetical protein M758_UG292900 [Ceratodon purpureus]
MAIVLLSIPLIPIPVITYISSDIHRQMQRVHIRENPGHQVERFLMSLLSRVLGVLTKKDLEVIGT